MTFNSENFKNYLKLHIDSKNTQYNYINRVDCFFKLYKELNQENLNEYFGKKIDNEISKSWLNQSFTAFRHYFSFIGISLELPKYKKVNKTEKDFLTEYELKVDILPYVDLIFDRKGEYYKFIITFLFYTGIRPSEMETIKTKDFNFNENIFIVRNPKDKEDKTVPFPDNLTSYIKKYFQPNNEYAFNINYKKIKYIFNKLNVQLGYKKRINSYLCRHSYAHYLLDNGVPVEKLQILMGHSDIKTTMIYAKPRVQDALKSYFDNIKPRKP